MVEIVAEISGSHGGDIKNAMLLITAAKQAGADAVKLQLFDPEKLAAKRANNPAVFAAAGGRRLLDLYREVATPREWFPKLFDFAADIGIEIYSSVFDPEDVEYLQKLKVTRYKVASFEANDHALIEACLQTGKPVIVSTSLWLSMDDIRDILTVVQDRTGRFTVLHATGYSQRTASQEDFTRFDLLRCKLPWCKLPSLGFSDHTGDPATVVSMVMLGAKMVEAHIALPEIETPDSGFSYTPRDFYGMVANVRRRTNQSA